MKIRYKLLVLVLFVLFPLILLPLMMYRAVNQTFKTTRHVLYNDIPVQNNSRELEKLIIEIHSEYQHYLSTNNEQSLSRFIHLVAEYNVVLDRQKKLLQGNVTETRRLEYINGLQEEWFTQAGLPAIIKRLEENNRQPVASNENTYTTIARPILVEIKNQFALANGEQQKVNLDRQSHAENLEYSLQRILVITFVIVTVGIITILVL